MQQDFGEIPKYVVKSMLNFVENAGLWRNLRNFVPLQDAIENEVCQTNIDCPLISGRNIS